MTPMRWLIFSFWVFVGGMLVWQSYTYETNLEKVNDAQPQHFFFDPSRDQKPAAADPNLHAADVRQTGYSVTNNPVSKSFVCHVVLTNKGNARAVGIQVFVRPFRGALVNGARNGDGELPHRLSDNDPLAQQGQSVEAPDLAPGESCTVSATFFMSRSDVQPSSNPNPQITFETEKANP
jgi:hypothetical protein